MHQRTGRDTEFYESNYGYCEGKITTTAKSHFHSIFLKNLEKELGKKEWTISELDPSPEGTEKTDTFLVSAKKETKSLDLFITVFFPEDQTVRVSYTEIIKQ